MRLEVSRSPQPPVDPGGIIELPMDDVRGRFVFDDGEVTMHDVNFKFRGAPVKFSAGKVFLAGQRRRSSCTSRISCVQAIRFDTDLRKKMPPLMSQFALRLDDGKTFRARGDLEIGWTGRKRASPPGASGRTPWSFSRTTRSRLASRSSTSRASSTT